MKRTNTYYIFSLSRLITLTVLLVILAAASARQEQETNKDVKQYAKDGVTFNFDKDWEHTDQSTAEAQQIGLSNKEADSQIMVIVLRRRVDSKEQVNDLKRQVFDQSVEGIITEYRKAGLEVERSMVKTEVGGDQAEGVRLKYSLDGRPGSTDLYWLMLNKRLVLLYFIRPDKMAEKAVLGWDTIRRSLRVEPDGQAGRARTAGQLQG